MFGLFFTSVYVVILPNDKLYFPRNYIFRWTLFFNFSFFQPKLLNFLQTWFFGFCFFSASTHFYFRFSRAFVRSLVGVIPFNCSKTRNRFMYYLKFYFQFSCPKPLNRISAFVGVHVKFFELCFHFLIAGPSFVPRLVFCSHSQRWANFVQQRGFVLIFAWNIPWKWSHFFLFLNLHKFDYVVSFDELKSFSAIFLIKQLSSLSFPFFHLSQSVVVWILKLAMSRFSVTCRHKTRLRHHGCACSFFRSMFTVLIIGMDVNLSESRSSTFLVAVSFKILLSVLCFLA